MCPPPPARVFERFAAESAPAGLRRAIADAIDAECELRPATRRQILRALYDVIVDVATHPLTDST